MKKYIKTYIDTLGFNECDFIPSEISGQKAVDVHHIISRGKKGGDNIENLIALTREEHSFYGDKKQYITYLLKIHKLYLERNNVNFNSEIINEIISKYED